MKLRDFNTQIISITCMLIVGMFLLNACSGRRQYRPGNDETRKYSKRHSNARMPLRRLNDYELAKDVPSEFSILDENRMALLKQTPISQLNDKPETKVYKSSKGLLKNVSTNTYLFQNGINESKTDHQQISLDESKTRKKDIVQETNVFIKENNSAGKGILLLVLGLLFLGLAYVFFIHLGVFLGTFFGLIFLIAAIVYGIYGLIVLLAAIF